MAEMLKSFRLSVILFLFIALLIGLYHEVEARGGRGGGGGSKGGSRGSSSRGRGSSSSRGSKGGGSSKGGSRTSSRGRPSIGSVSTKTRVAISKYTGPRYKSSYWKIGMAADSIYGATRYLRHDMSKKEQDYEKELTVCFNAVKLRAGKYGYFICPEEGEPENYDQCCGEEGDQECCKPSEGAGVLVGVTIGFLVGAGIVLGIIVFCCRKIEYKCCMKNGNTKESKAQPPIHSDKAYEPEMQPLTNENGFVINGGKNEIEDQQSKDLAKPYDPEMHALHISKHPKGVEGMRVVRFDDSTNESNTQRPKHLIEPDDPPDSQPETVHISQLRLISIDGMPVDDRKHDSKVHQSRHIAEPMKPYASEMHTLTKIPEIPSLTDVNGSVVGSDSKPQPPTYSMVHNYPKDHCS